MTNQETNQITGAKAVQWTTRKEIVECCLVECERCGGNGLISVAVITGSGFINQGYDLCPDCRGHQTASVEVEVSESETGILELLSINTFGVPRENFQSLSTDIGELFKKGYEKSPYKEYRGFFTIEIK